MKRILIRSGKSPFRTTTAREVIHQDLIGTNSGNLLFSDAAHKLLLTGDTEVTSNGIRTDPSPERAAQINEQYDVFVVPLANSFRPDFDRGLNKLASLIEQLTIPVVVFGVGAQSGADYDPGPLASIEPAAKRLMRAVLDRSASVGVRGEFTADYLKGLGFSDVEIIGCPSMFGHGPEFPEIRPATGLDHESPVAINISHDAASEGEIAAIARRAAERYPRLRYFAQNLSDAELMFWGDTSEAAGTYTAMPEAGSHPLISDRRTLLCFDSTTWIETLRGYDFAFGTRIHGGVAALLAGTPSVVLCHDSRTLELCRYFDIPHRMLPDLPADLDPADLLAEADFTALRRGHRERFDRLTGFLDRNGLENTFTHGDQGASFDARLAEHSFAPPLEVWDGSDDGDLDYRFGWLRQRLRRAGEKQTAAGQRIAKLRTENARLREQVEQAQSRLDAVEKRVGGIEKRAAVRIGPAIRRRLRRR